MSEVTGDTIKELLADPKNLDTIAALVSGLSAGGAPKEAEDGMKGKEAESGEALPQEAVPERLADTVNRMTTSMGGDKRIALLKAIKPYVSDEKKERVDGLVRAIGVAGMIKQYKDSGFGGLLG